MFVSTHFPGNPVTKNEMGWACSTYWGGELHVGCWWGNLSERYHLAHTCVRGRMITKWNLKEIKWDAVDWINLSQDRDEIKWNLKEIEWDAVNWINLAQDRDE